MTPLIRTDYLKLQWRQLTSILVYRCRGFCIKRHRSNRGWLNGSSKDFLYGFQLQLYSHVVVDHKCVKHIDSPFKSNGINRSIGVPAMIVNYFEDARSLTLPGPRTWVFASKPRHAEGGSNLILKNCFGES